MSRPIIGITTGRRNIWSALSEGQTAAVTCSLAYQQSVERSGGAPVLLPRTDDEAVVASVMSIVDGLLLSGGGDVVSLAYGAEPHPKTTYQDPIRDRMEFQAVRVAVERRLPILGICRGIQSLNVALGGTLVQDIHSEVPGASQHYTRERETVLAHTVDIEGDSLLAKVLRTTATAVNSWHHQAVAEVAEGLRVNCRARDGVIEGIEARDGRSILAVQCHPEACCRDYPLFQRLFDWLVEEAGRGPRAAGHRS
ncbi:MAG: gamma-glutamyl-gamma-aminobutyrate hydrolase family protein [Phycisphaerae bacterium]